MSLVSLGLGSVFKALASDAKPVIAHYFSTPEEQANAQAVIEKLAQAPAAAQVRIDVAEAESGSVFIAGWRPAVGWICALALGWGYIIAPVLSLALGYALPTFRVSGLDEILYAMLGIDAGTQVSAHWAARKAG